MDIELPPGVIADLDQRTTALNHWLDGMIDVVRDEMPAVTPTERIVAFSGALKQMIRRQGELGIKATSDTLAMAIVRLAAVQDAAEGEL